LNVNMIDITSANIVVCGCTLADWPSETIIQEQTYNELFN